MGGVVGGVDEALVASGISGNGGKSGSVLFGMLLCAGTALAASAETASPAREASVPWPTPAVSTDAA